MIGEQRFQSQRQPKETMMRHFQPLIAALALAWATLDGTLASRAAALVITTCGVTCTTDCELGSNIVCTDGQNGVVLANGADLDLRGFDVRCTYDSDDPGNAPVIGSCGVGVRMTGAGSRIFSSASLDPADPTPRIRGVWTHAVECQAMASSQLSGIRIEYIGYGYAVDRCAIVEQNVILGRPHIWFEGGVEMNHITYRYPELGVRIGAITLRVSDNVVDGFLDPMTRLGSGGTQSLLIENKRRQLPRLLSSGDTVLRHRSEFAHGVTWNDPREHHRRGRPQIRHQVGRQ